MSMFSEIATEETIKSIVDEIKKEMQNNENNLDVVNALKKIGRFTLTQFEWSTPDWVEKYEKLFRE